MSCSYEKVMASKNFLPFHLDQLTPKMLQLAEEELNENEKTRLSSIEQLRKLINKEDNLKCRIDDEFLLQFLRARKFNVKKAFTRLQTLYTVFSKTFSDVYTNVDVENVKAAFRSGFGSHLPYRDEEGAAVAFFKINRWNTEELDAFSILNCATAVALSAVDKPATQVCGLQVLLDVRGTTFQHMRCLSPRFLYLVAKGLRDTLPVRFKGIHIINASSVFRYMWSIINIFLSEKMRKRVHFHNGNLENLHKFIPKEILPTDYGGDNPSFDPVKSGSEELDKFLLKYFEITRDGYKKN